MESKLANAIIARANSTTAPTVPTDFEPSESLKQIAGALCESTADTWGELAEQAGVSRSTLHRVLADPSSLQWLASEASRLVAGHLGAVHLALLQKALSSNNPAFVRLYLLRFDPEFQKTEIAARGRNTQVNNFESMSPAELNKHIQREIRKLGLVSNSDPGPDH